MTTTGTATQTRIDPIDEIFNALDYLTARDDATSYTHDDLYEVIASNAPSIDWWTFETALNTLRDSGEITLAGLGIKRPQH